ncbi:MAG: hypothetical protein FWE03_02210 [Firmicutes bacterium]|nr:hypothetical protein [Bacillota bacterium]
MDKYEGMNKPKCISYALEYKVLNKTNKLIEKQEFKHPKSINKTKSFLIFRLIACVLLLVFPLAARFTNLSIAHTINDFLIRELTREVNLPFINADADYCYHEKI